MSIKSDIKKYLQENLKPNRYNHVLGVCTTAIELAERYNIDKEKAEIAALLHDVAKNLTEEVLLKEIESENITLSVDEKNTK